MFDSSSLPVSTLAIVTVYPRMSPFCWSEGGGVQERRRDRGPSTVTVKDWGGAVGTVRREYNIAW